MGSQTRLVCHKAELHFGQRLAYHWRPEDYQETDAYLHGGDPPRWQARHICRLGQGHFGIYDWDANPHFTPGDTVGACGTSEGRHIGPVQLKVGFRSQVAQPGGLPWTMTVELDCLLPGGGVETRRVTLPQGSKGPADPSDPQDWGDLVRVVCTERYVADGEPSPYLGAGLYEGVGDVRTVAHSTLAQEIGSEDTRVPVADGSRFETDGGIVKVDAEFIRYGGVAEDWLVNCIRGYDDPILGNSDPAPHSRGAAVDGQYPGCYLKVWSDAPSLHDTGGVKVKDEQWSFFAAALGQRWGRPHYFEDHVGQLHRFYVSEGDIWHQKKAGVPGRWSSARRVTHDKRSDYPCGDKNARGVIWLVRQVERSEVRLRTSLNDGQSFEESSEVTIANDLRFPYAVEYGGIIYLIGYRSGGQYIRRTADYGHTFLSYPGGATEAFVANSDSQRVAFVKMESAGRRLVVGVPREPEIVTYVSEDDGATWAEA